EIPASVNDVHAIPRPGDLHVALGGGDLGIAPAHVDAHFTIGVAHIDVAAPAVYIHRRAHIRHRNVALLVSDGHRGLARHHHVHVHADARIAARWLYLEAIAIRHDFDAHPLGNALRIGLVPTAHVLLPIHTNFRLIGRPHADIATNAANRNARIHGHRFRAHIKIDGGRVSARPIGEVLLDAFHRYDDSDQRQ